MVFSGSEPRVKGDEVQYEGYDNPVVFVYSLLALILFNIKIFANTLCVLLF